MSSHLRQQRYTTGGTVTVGKRRSEPLFSVGANGQIVGILKEQEANILVVDLFHNKSRCELRAIDGLRRRHRMDGRAKTAVSRRICVTAAMRTDFIEAMAHPNSLAGGVLPFAAYLRRISSLGTREREEVDDEADRAPDAIDGSPRGLAQECFDLFSIGLKSGL